MYCMLLLSPSFPFVGHISVKTFVTSIKGQFGDGLWADRVLKSESKRLIYSFQGIY